MYATIAGQIIVIAIPSKQSFYASEFNKNAIHAEGGADHRIDSGAQRPCRGSDGKRYKRS